MEEFRICCKVDAQVVGVDGSTIYSRQKSNGSINTILFYDFLNSFYRAVLGS